MSEKFEDMTKEELMDEAQRLDIDGRSTMDKAELLAAVQAAEGSDESSESGDETTETTQASESDVTDGAAVDTEAALLDEPNQEENGGFHVESDIPEVSGITAGDTDTDPVKDSEADYTETKVEYVQDTNEVKSRQQEEDEQHERRKAGDARVQEIADQAGRTPY